ncbi:hypothetical protein [Leisingera sp. D0M16]|uniref:hypothetical protein n=1 Tax=Leisingera coralii TaxID=3351347 RepID=UPI003B9F1BF3
MPDNHLKYISKYLIPLQAEQLRAVPGQDRPAQNMREFLAAFQNGAKLNSW